MRDIEITQSLIYDKLKILKQNKAPGVDNLDSDFLNKVADIISYPMTRIFRKSLGSGLVPTDWKQANVGNFLKRVKRHYQEIIVQSA